MSTCTQTKLFAFAMTFLSVKVWLSIRLHQPHHVAPNWATTSLCCCWAMSCALVRLSRNSIDLAAGAVVTTETLTCGEVCANAIDETAQATTPRIRREAAK